MIRPLHSTLLFMLFVQLKSNEKMSLPFENKSDVYDYENYLEVERTVRCSRTVRFLLMFGRFEVRFMAKIRCSDMFEVRF